jgi:6-pyruvoyltetrahydropterin/6-carboxytetrahydropterin synthase
MIKCTRRIEFDAGHRVVGHQNKCNFLHGHRYVVEVTAASESLNNLGMVIDFSDMKSIIKNWIDDNFDHSLILHKDDKYIGEQISAWTGQKIYYMEQNPTAENIALHLKLDVLPKLFNDRSFYIDRLKLFETPNCFVEV